VAGGIAIEVHVEFDGEDPHIHGCKARSGDGQDLASVIDLPIKQRLLSLQEGERGDEDGDLKNCSPHTRDDGPGALIPPRQQGD
jgi:hypothetical protein